ncbi:hypothetical protein [Vibrio chagasii]|uniref:hypothetical protein n=1 Tax=Vibrio chagasii TaxID=170679 RepID=UPI002283A0E6|nr:hypothetical protein [Vibrio chagasii]MCY9828810.1 hypothetical protein [Vibrio chagasii]
MHELQFKPLIRLWDKSIEQSSTHKSLAYDGQFAIKSLFSIEAFSTNPKVANPLYCREALGIFLDDIRQVRFHITSTHKQQKASWGDITLVPFKAEKHRLVMTINERHLCRSTGLLLKTFDTANDYLLDLHRAQHNEELSDAEFLESRNALLKTMAGLLHKVTTKSRIFHIERKKLEQTK